MNEKETNLRRRSRASEERVRATGAEWAEARRVSMNGAIINHRPRLEKATVEFNEAVAEKKQIRKEWQSLEREQKRARLKAI